MGIGVQLDQSGSAQKIKWGEREREEASERKKVEKNGMWEKQEEARDSEEVVSWSIKCIQEVLGKKKQVTSAELHGWAKCFYFSKMLKTGLYMKLFKIIILAQAQGNRT